LPDVVVWAILVACLTIIGVVWIDAEHLDYDDASPAILLIGYSPALAAIATVGLLSGAGGLRALLSQFRRWRAGIGWYAIAAFAPLAVVLLATGILVLRGGAAPGRWLVLPALATVPSLLGPIVAGSLGEELGWRGFAQPRLQIRLDALPAAILVGLAWSLWHVWPLLTPSGFGTATAAGSLVISLLYVAAAGVVLALTDPRTLTRAG